MTRKYIEEENGTIWYEENGFRISFVKNEANSEYQAYLAWLEDPTAQSKEIMPPTT